MTVDENTNEFKTILKYKFDMQIKCNYKALPYLKYKKKK